MLEPRIRRPSRTSFGRCSVVPLTGLSLAVPGWCCFPRLIGTALIALAGYLVVASVGAAAMGHHLSTWIAGMA